MGAENSVAASRAPHRLTARRTAIVPRPKASVSRDGERRGERGDAGRDRDGHGEDVVGQQAARCEERRRVAEIHVGHDIGAAAVRVGADHLTVGQPHGDDQHDDRHGERKRRAERAAAGERARADGLGPPTSRFTPDRFACASRESRVASRESRVASRESRVASRESRVASQGWDGIRWRSLSARMRLASPASDQAARTTSGSACWASGK